MNIHSKNALSRIPLLLLALILSATSVISQTAQTDIEGWDVSALDARIARVLANAGDFQASSKAKLEVVAAYMDRANFFYGAGQPALYKFALGDFRRVLRFQPDNVEAHKKAEQLISIYKSMERPVPANGGETDIYNDPDARYRLKPQPITFMDGKTSKTLTRMLPSDVGYVYEVSAYSGQRIRVRVASPNGAASVRIYQGRFDDPSAMVAEGITWDSVASDTGKYLIRVSSTRGPVTYELKLSVRK